MSTTAGCGVSPLARLEPGRPLEIAYDPDPTDVRRRVA
jgi:hypothetical protein